MPTLKCPYFLLWELRHLLNLSVSFSKVDEQNVEMSNNSKLLDKVKSYALKF